MKFKYNVIFIDNNTNESIVVFKNVSQEEATRLSDSLDCMLRTQNEPVRNCRTGFVLNTEEG